MNLRLTGHLLLLTALSISLTRSSNAQDIFYPLSFSDQHLEIQAEIALNQAQRELGLMHRIQLDENRGMLFVYPQAARHGVWMKNMLLSLDVLFLSADGRITALLPQLPPCRREPCQIYRAPMPAKFMLELNSGFIERHQIKIGQTVRLPEFR